VHHIAPTTGTGAGQRRDVHAGPVRASVAVGTALRPCGFGPPLAQIPASGITALGSYLGYVAAKRTSG
jgi:hypothetical protein